MQTITNGIYLIDNFTTSKIEIFKDCKFNDFTINNKKLCRTGSFEGDQ